MSEVSIICLIVYAVVFPLVVLILKGLINILFNVLDWIWKRVKLLGKRLILFVKNKSWKRFREATGFEEIDILKKTESSEVATKIDELYSNEEWVNERFKNQQLFKRKAHLMESLADTNKNKGFFDVSAVSLCTLICSTLLSSGILKMFISNDSSEKAMANSVVFVFIFLIYLLAIMKMVFDLEPTETKEREFSRYELMHIERVFNEHVNGGIKKDSKDVM